MSRLHLEREPVRRSGLNLEDAVVGDAMHTGILSCLPETPLRIVARMMAANRIHGVVVLGAPRNYADERAWRIVSDLDLARALGPGFEHHAAGDAATSEILTVTPRDPLTHASELMSERGTTHLIVVDPDEDHPIGIISTLDIAAVAGWAAHSHHDATA